LDSGFDYFGCSQLKGMSAPDSELYRINEQTDISVERCFIGLKGKAKVSYFVYIRTFEYNL